ncbi:MAG: hypothetical protein JWO38_2246 [Gemmataceae bacterium]|nr:hypothetical protein [Gemmataceae bacterium]
MGKHAGTLVEDVEYPSSDGKPMAETDLHRKLMNEVIEVLSGHFAGDPDVYVSGNLLAYYEKGNPASTCRRTASSSGGSRPATGITTVCGKRVGFPILSWK